MNLLSWYRGAETRAIALAYYDAGLVPIPARLDGTKRPAVPSWKKYQAEKPTKSAVARMFHGIAGICVLMGLASGGAECIDFDDPEPFSPIWNSCSNDLKSRLAIYETPRGGWHVVYRCSEWHPSVKLARRSNGSTRIETRGEGGYIIAEGSPLKVHEAGLPYCHWWGRQLTNLGEITPEERAYLWRACAEYDESGEPTHSQKLGRKLAEREYRSTVLITPKSLRQASAYLSKMDPAIQGSNGSGALYRAACKMVEFGLSRDTVIQLLISEYNPRCRPEWSEREIIHKVEDAMENLNHV